MKIFRKPAFYAVLMLSMPLALHAQDNKPLPSPRETHSTSFINPSGGETTITLDFGAPSMRGRKIMGDLVPYGQVWRTGANAATMFVFNGGDLMVGDKRVPADNYTLYTLPAAPGTPWQLIVNKQTGQWGTVYDATKDFARSPMHYKKLAAPQETMSITFENMSPNSDAGELHIRWETTDAWVEVKTAK